MYELDKKRIRLSQMPTLAKQQGWIPKVKSTHLPDVDPASAEAEIARRTEIEKLYKNNLI